MEFKRSKLDKNYTEIVITVYNFLSNKHKYTSRISDIFLLLRESFGISEFEILDTRLCNNGVLESFLIDKFIDWQNDKEVDFIEVYNKILEIGDFTKSEKDLFESGKVEERLWAIFLSISDPEKPELINNLINYNY